MANLKELGYGVGKYLTVSDASDIPDIGTNRQNIDLLNFKVATNNAYALYNFKDGMIDAYQTEGGVDATTSLNETYDSSGKYYSGAVPSSLLNAYTSGSGNFTAPAGVTSVEVLVVAGGGGGGGYGGGGGAGGIVHHTGYTVVPSSTYAYSVGTGGNGGNYNGSQGGNGGDSTFGTGTVMTAVGGGGGASGPGAGSTGGNGGGGNSGYNSPGGVGNQGDSGGGTGYGHNDGGQGYGGGVYGGAGGGATADGTAGNVPAGWGGTGGAGKLFAGFEAYGTDSNNVASTGSNGGYFGGGGGGCSSPANKGGPGGVGGGAIGATGNNSANSTVPNTGGGGGAATNNTGGAGAAGIVIVLQAESYDDMTLISNAQTANQADPTEGRLMIYEETSTGSTTLDTDLKGYVSRNNGTTYTQVPLTLDGYLNAQGGIDSNTKLMLHMDGANDGTTFTDSSDSPYTVTPVGNIHTDTAVKKFGTASAQCDGTGDYLTVPYNADWNFGTNDWTVDCWVRFDVNNTWQTLVWFGYTNQCWFIDYKGTTNELRLYMKDTVGGNNNVTQSWTPVVDTWYHIAGVRDGNNLMLFVDGTQLGSSTSVTGLTALNDTSGGPAIGGRITSGGGTLDRYLDGYIDEVRVVNGTATWTGNFTPPNRPYTSGVYGSSQRLLSGSVDISGQPAGSNMKYKIETLNQSVSKVCRLHGASLLWA